MRFTRLVLCLFAFCAIEDAAVSAAVMMRGTNEGRTKQIEVGISWEWFRQLMAIRSISFDIQGHSRLRIGTVYENTALVLELPDQPDRMVQMLLSIIVSENDFTQDVNEAMINCMAQNSSTERKHWGLYNSERFTPSLLQAEYFAEVSEDASLSFPLTVDEYVRKGELRQCVLDKGVGLTEGGSLLSGRTTIAPRSGLIVSSAGSIPGWLVGAIVGGLTLVALIGIVIFSAHEGRVYHESDYESPRGEKVGNGDDLEMGVDQEEAQRRLSEELRTIAGQRNDALFAEG